MTHDSKSSRDALLDVACRLFTAKGYAAVSTRDIAEAAEVNLGSIQYHFGSKAKLFVETIYRIMEQSSYAMMRTLLSQPIRNDQEAADRLASFIYLFLGHLLHQSGPLPCRMMIRETLSATSEEPEMNEVLVCSFVRDFIQPMDELLRGLMAQLSPNASADELRLHIASITGQCCYFLTNRPFYERLSGKNPAELVHFHEIAAHIIRVTLRAIGCREGIATKAVAHAAAEYSSAHPKTSTRSSCTENQNYE